MVHPNRCAFTLVELLVVITVIAIMIVLLMPAFSSAYQYAQMTVCQRHLKSIWDAMAMYRCDKGTALFATGRSWTGLLLPYLERNQEVYHCPLVKARLGTNTGGTVTSTNPAATPIPSAAGSGPGPDTTAGERQVDISVDIYDTHLDNPNSSLLWNCSIDSPWCKKSASQDQDGNCLAPNEVWCGIEDWGYIGGGSDPNFKDATFIITYDAAGAPTKIKLLMSYRNPGRGFKLRVNGEVVHLPNLINPAAIDDMFWNPGVEIMLQSSETQTAGTPPAATGPGITSQAVVVTVTYVPTDYGLSRGYYTQTISHQDAPLVDSRLFMVMDFPKSLVDYTDLNQSSGSASSSNSWDKYFIDTAANPNALQNWQESFAETCGTDWEQYQALRHFTKANVLFCDGHIESLGGDDLAESDPRWQYGAK